MSGEFVDTNVLVYAHDRSAGAKRRRAAELIIRLGRAQAGIISVQVLMELLATLTRKLNRPLPLATAADIIDDLVSWRVYEPKAADVGEAARIAGRYGISTWDAMIILAASLSGAEVLWTEDLNHGQLYEGVTVMNPFLASA